MKNKGLGKGLSALLGDNNDVVDIKKFDKFNTNLTPIHLLKPNQFQCPYFTGKIKNGKDCKCSKTARIHRRNKSRSKSNYLKSGSPKKAS